MNSDSKAKNRFSKKLLAITVVIIVVIAIVVSWQIFKPSSTVIKSNVILPALSLTLVGANGQQRILNSNELAGLTSYTSNGGYRGEGTMNATIYAGNFTGVPVLTLLNLVGGVSNSENVNFICSDGYQVTFTYQQLQGQEINTFDPNTGAAVQPSQPLTVIVAYYSNDTNIVSGKGPLTVAIVGPQGLYTNGYWWAYLLVRIQVIPA
ncbi:MAG TPA: hypothetical protein VEF91_06585 [Verrucomicrobiae bacterium]|nr:hypothetical protein [Verrucomicrobiae bacterium]